MRSGYEVRRRQAAMNNEVVFEVATQGVPIIPAAGGGGNLSLASAFAHTWRAALERRALAPISRSPRPPCSHRGRSSCAVARCMRRHACEARASVGRALARRPVSDIGFGGSCRRTAGMAPGRISRRPGTERPRSAEVVIDVVDLVPGGL